MNIKCKFGERLKSLRQSKDMNQKELAEVLNISQSAIANYENGIKEPNMQMIVNMSEFFNVSTDFLLAVSSVPDEKKTLNVINRLPENERKKVTKDIEMYAEFLVLKTLYDR